MAETLDNPSERFQFSGFGDSPAAGGGDFVFLLVISHEGSLTAAAYATEAGAMSAALDFLEGEWDPGDEGGTPEDLYAQAQEYLTSEGGVMEIIPSPIYGA